MFHKIQAKLILGGRFEIAVPVLLSRAELSDLLSRW